MVINQSLIMTTMGTNGSRSTSASFVVDPFKHDLPLATEVIIGVLFLIGFPCGLFGNILVIMAILLTKLRRRLSNLLILNLAFTDVLVSALPMPVYGIYYVFYWPQWNFGSGLCKASLYVMRVCGSMSVLTLVVIALDRYFAVIRNKRLLTRIRTKCLLAFLWILCFVSMIYPLVGSGLERVNLGGKEFDICQKMSGEVIKEKSYFATLLMQTVISVFIVFVLVGAYVSMISSIWRSKQIQAPEDSAVQGKRQNARAVKMMFFILVAFFTSWVPYWIVTLFRLYPIDEKKGIDPSVVLFFYSLAILNSAWNPVLYALISKAFRLAYRQVVTGDFNYSYRSTTHRDGTRATRLRTGTGMHKPRTPEPSPNIITNRSVADAETPRI